MIHLLLVDFAVLYLCLAYLLCLSALFSFIVANTILFCGHNKQSHNLFLPPVLPNAQRHYHFVLDALHRYIMPTSNFGFLFAILPYVHKFHLFASMLLVCLLRQLYHHLAPQFYLLLLWYACDVQSQELFYP